MADSRFSYSLDEIKQMSEDVLKVAKEHGASSAEAGFLVCGLMEYLVLWPLILIANCLVLGRKQVMQEATPETWRRLVLLWVRS